MPATHRSFRTGFEPAARHVATPDEWAEAVEQAPSWNARVGLIRRIPEELGTSQHQVVYARVADRVYVPHLKPDFAYMHWRPGYELEPFAATYDEAAVLTNGFERTELEDLSRVISVAPRTLRVFRLLLGLTGAEFAEACAMVAVDQGLSGVSKGRVDSIEAGRGGPPGQIKTCAVVIHLAMTGALFPVETGSGLRSKQDKPDTADGWNSVRRFAKNGVPFAVFLHQRAYGGAFRQLLDATSTMRGNLLEDPVADLFSEAGVPHIRTGSHNQRDIEERFGLTVRPAPDFVVYDNRADVLRALLEIKGANDGGTARDKAARFRVLRAEANRLGGVPLFAVLGGTGWRRAQDALGPVIRDTDGRVFTVATLAEMLEVEPFPSLAGMVQAFGYDSPIGDDRES